MDFELSEEQRAFRETARQFAAERLAPHAADWDKRCHFPVETLREAARLGFAGIYTGDAHGGAGLCRLDAAIIFEELATGCTSTAAYLSIHNMVAWMIDAFGTEEQRARWLPDLDDHGALRQLLPDRARRRVGRGEPRDPGAAAGRPLHPERQQGVHLRRRHQRSLRLHGAHGRRWAQGHQLRGGRARQRGPGLRQAGEEARLALAADRDGDLRGLRGAASPTGWAAEGEGFTIAMRGLDGGRVNIAACALGAARACFDKARAHLQERRQFGRRLAAFQALQFKLADMATELEAARLMVHRAAALLDRGAPDATVACAMAKRFATDAAFRVCNDALQLHGGYGYIEDYEIERYLRDVRVHQILEGTNEIMRVIIARRLLDA